MDEVIQEFSRIKLRRFYECIDENGKIVESGTTDNINSVGDDVEEIFGKYMCKKLPGFRCGPKQKSPDFFYGDMEIELKVFKGSPGFDIGNYYSYIHELSVPGGVQRKFFNTLYIIFEYDIEDSYIIFKNYHIKRVWEIVSLKTKYPISCQVKKNKIYNIRPISSKTFKQNNSIKDVMKSVIDLIKMFPSEKSTEYIESIEHQFDQFFDDWRGCHIPEQII
jgi:hypothetical protein